MSAESCGRCGTGVRARRRGTGFCTQRCEDAQATEDRVSAKDEAEQTDPYALGFGLVADACDALIASDNTGGGMLICWVRDAASELRAADLDAAEASIDAASGEIEVIREQIAALRRGEVIGG